MRVGPRTVTTQRQRRLLQRGLASALARRTGSFPSGPDATRAVMRVTAICQDRPLLCDRPPRRGRHGQVWQPTDTLPETFARRHDVVRRSVDVAP